jgi:histidinol-phosphate/aromatic aminotransferase/cobyric acid decarboxylase-like protein
LTVPATARGNIDLDEVHKPIIERIMRAYAGQTVGLGDFSYVYPTSGSSEGIYHVLTRVAREGTTTINTLVGEYEGYREQGKNVGLSTKEWEIDDPAISKLPAGSVWFLSNPCARDGNILPDDFLAMLCQMGHKLVLDLAYVGATAPHCFDLTHENVMAVVTSFSKPYGTFRLRIGGMTFSREQMPTLYGNKWFKDVQRLFQALALAERIGPEGLYPKYRPVQESIVSALNQRFNLELVP